MNTAKNIAIILFIILIGYLIYDKFFVSHDKVTTATIHDTIPGDNIVQKDTLKMPVPYAVYQDPEIITLPADSLCIKQWYELKKLYGEYKLYTDTLKDDSSALLVVSDTVHNNSLRSRLFEFQNRRPTFINNVTNEIVVNDGNGFFIGGGLIGTSPGAEFSIVKNRWMFDGGYYDKKIKISVKYRLFKL